MHGVHGPLEDNLLFFDLLVHKISAKEENNLGVESFFTDFLDKTTHFKHFNFISVGINGFKLLFDTSIIEDNLSRGHLKKYILSGFPRGLTPGEILKFTGFPQFILPHSMLILLNGLLI